MFFLPLPFLLLTAETLLGASENINKAKATNWRRNTEACEELRTYDTACSTQHDAYLQNTGLCSSIINIYKLQFKNVD